MAKQIFSKAQQDLKQPRVVIYAGKNKNCDPELARHILELYIVCQFGYTPIKHVLGQLNDKKIEDVVRQHMLGRRNVRGENGELFCPSNKKLSDKSRSIVIELARMYNTLEDPYVETMLKTGIWEDESKPNRAEDEVDYSVCPECGAEYTENAKYCAACGHNRSLDK